MKGFLKILVFFALVIILFFVSAVFLFSSTGFSQASTLESSNLQKLNLPFVVNFSDKETKFLNSLAPTDLEKLVKVIKLIVEKNKSAQSSNSKIEQFFSGQNQPTTYSNNPSPQTPYFNPSTGQYQSSPSSPSSPSSGPINNSSSPQQGPVGPQQQTPLQSMLQPIRDPATGQPTTPLGQLMDGLKKGLAPIENDPKNCGGLATHKEMEDILTPLGIKIKSSGNCSNPNNRSCTSLEKMPRKVILLLKEIKTNCSGCDITITGGTEVGHSSHRQGVARLDLSKNPALDKFLYSIGLKLKGATFLDEKPGQFANTTGAHWHVDAVNYACQK